MISNQTRYGYLFTKTISESLWVKFGIILYFVNESLKLDESFVFIPIILNEIWHRFSNYFVTLLKKHSIHQWSIPSNKSCSFSQASDNVITKQIMVVLYHVIVNESFLFQEFETYALNNCWFRNKSGFERITRIIYVIFFHFQN